MPGKNIRGLKGFQQVIPQNLIDAIRASYVAGFSTRQLAELYLVSKTRIAQFVQDIARTPSEANQLRFPPQSKHWRSSRAAARKKMERKLGRKLDRSEHVHHIDHDFTNNDETNLQIVDASEHGRMHAYEHPVPLRGKGWHHTEETKIRIGLGHALSSELQTQIVELYTKGIPIKQIQEQLSVSKPSIFRYVHKADLEMRND
jgi:transposase